MRDPEVPRGLRYPADRRAPCRKKRADAQHFADDRGWYLDNAFTEEWGKLRYASLSVQYWDRFCLFVSFMDGLGPNKFSAVWDYLAVGNVERYFSHLGEGIEKKGGRKEPTCLDGWIQYFIFCCKK